jgi:5'-3' exonuclease
MGGSKLHEFFVDDVALKFIDDVAGDSVVGVDASWLQHKYLLPYEAEIRAQRYDRAVGEFIVRVQLLTKCGVAVHVVFDGTTPPCKREEAARRQKAGSSIRTRGLQRAIIAALKHLGLRYTVAPYEAEAQLAHLQRCGDVVYIMACDADYFALGCSRILWNSKLAGKTPISMLIDTDATVARPSHVKIPLYSTLLQLVENHGKFILKLYAVLAGCDYVDFKGIGSAKAIAILVSLDQKRDFSSPAIATEVHRRSSDGQPFEHSYRQVEKGMLCFTKPVVYDHSTKCRTVLDGSTLTSEDEMIVGSCNVHYNAETFARGDIDPETGTLDVITPWIPNMDMFWSAHNLSIEGRDLPGSSCATGTEAEYVARDANSRRRYYVMNDVLHGNPDTVVGANQLDHREQSKKLYEFQARKDQMRKQGCVHTLRDPKGRSTREIVEAARGQSAAVGSGLEDDLRPPEWVLKLPRPLTPTWKDAPLLSDAVILAWFKRLKPDANRNTLSAYKEGVSWAKEARNPDTYRLAMVPVDGAKSDVRVYWLSKWASRYSPTKIYDVHITFYASGELVEQSSLKEVLSVDWATCTCRAGPLAHCTHIAAAMVGYKHLERPTCTSVPCAWTKLGPTNPDTSTAVANIPHGRGTGDIDARDGQSPAVRSATVESPRRHTWVATDASTSTEIEAYDDRSLENKFFALVLESFGGEPCAAQRFRDASLEIPPPKNQLSWVMNDSRLG